MSQLREAMAAVKASPRNPVAWIALGDLLASDGQSEKATQSYQRALQLDPTNQAAQRGLAQLIIQNAGNASPAAPSAPSRPAPASEPSRAAPPATPNRPAPESRRATPPPEVRRPVSPPTPAQRRSAEEPISRPARPTSAPRRDDPAPAPRAEPSATSRSVGRMASTFEMRERPARPRKPSEGRVRAGLLFIIFIPVVCICVLALAVSQVFQLLSG